MDSLPNDNVPKPSFGSRIFDIIPKRGPLGRLASIINSVSRVGGPVQAAQLAFAVIQRTGIRHLVTLVRNASKTYATTLQHGYEDWARRFLDLPEPKVLQLLQRIGELETQPKISVLMPTYNSPPDFLALAINSVRNQLYKNWELCIADDFSTDDACRKQIEEAAAGDARIKFVFRANNGHISEASNSCLELATGDYVTFLDHDDELTPDALAVMALYANANPSVEFFYSDEDKIDPAGRRSEPHFKPDLDRTLAFSVNYFCHMSMYRASRVRELGGLRSQFDGAQDYDLALRMLNVLDDSKILHVPHVLYHWRILPQSTSSNLNAKPYAMPASRAALSQFVESSGLQATITPNPELPTLNRVSPKIIGSPLITIIIPTRDQVEILKTCIQSVLAKTSYSRYEILIVNNGSVEMETLEYFKSIQNPRIRVLDYPAAFNYSAINNFAADHGNGEYICLLNNDIEVLTEDWLEQLLSFAQLPQIGAVGAKLFYPDGRIQHAGVVLGLGGLSSVAGHAHKRFPGESQGYMGRTMLTQQFSAVTGACLMVSRAKYLEVGGLTEELSVGFNDVDFCLKLLVAGYKNVLNPHAQLIHHESLTRGLDLSKDQIWRASQESLYMLSHWGELLQNDPAYNRHLTTAYEDFSLAWPPRKSNGVY